MWLFLVLFGLPRRGIKLFCLFSLLIFASVSWLHPPFFRVQCACRLSGVSCFFAWFIGEYSFAQKIWNTDSRMFIFLIFFIFVWGSGGGRWGYVMVCLLVSIDSFFFLERVIFHWNFCKWVILLVIFPLLWGRVDVIPGWCAARWCWSLQTVANVNRSSELSSFRLPPDAPHSDSGTSFWLWLAPSTLTCIGLKHYFPNDVTLFRFIVSKTRLHSGPLRLWLHLVIATTWRFAHGLLVWICCPLSWSCGAKGTSLVVTACQIKQLFSIFWQ
jgi:hypothetical protein